MGLKGPKIDHKMAHHRDVARIGFAAVIGAAIVMASVVVVLHTSSQVSLMTFFVLHLQMLKLSA